MNDIQATDLGGASGDLSTWGLIMGADFLVQMIMLMLLVASVWSWTIIFSKRAMLKRLNRKASVFEDSFWSGESLDKIYQRVKNSSGDPMLNTFSAGMEEWKNGIAGGVPSEERFQASLRQRIDRAMFVTINREMNALERGMTFLATVGSVAPFMGLFGTVWGIMNSFTSIAGQQNTSLLVVAPGIAEALLTTALGLVAAIPATVAYNAFSSVLNRYAYRLEAFADEFSAILSRHLDSYKENEATQIQNVSGSKSSNKKVA